MWTTDRVPSNQNPIWNSHAVITAWKNTTLRFEVSSLKGGKEIKIGEVIMPIREAVEVSKPEWHVINEAQVEKKGMLGNTRRLSLSDVFNLGNLLVGTTVLEPWKLKELLDNNAIMERQVSDGFERECGPTAPPRERLAPTTASTITRERAARRATATARGHPKPLPTPLGRHSGGGGMAGEGPRSA